MNLRKMVMKNYKLFRVTLIGEQADDCGGPFRDAISDICNELMSNVLPLLRPTANNRSNIEPETDCFQLNERCKEPVNLV